MIRHREPAQLDYIVLQNGKMCLFINGKWEIINSLLS
ncbi:hypothetical protein [Nitrososphaeria virus YSH_922147]|uniref:Uncharacterized protein n=1 Tax=Nitrososphaeria virus YSH_922147 TaxID=3071323 RepID=A0A976YF51_9CAUD|nr:hypothetical protein QKV94_gp17 [Yangshan Harbor Nitrososphaeria virus]UVF62426.1 hypothetical protein [Nitrososphaeria virus YSH_922147]